MSNFVLVYSDKNRSKVLCCPLWKAPFGSAGETRIGNAGETGTWWFCLDLETENPLERRQPKVGEILGGKINWN